MLMVTLLFFMMTTKRYMYCDRKFEHPENIDPFRCPTCEKNNIRKIVKWK